MLDSTSVGEPPGVHDYLEDFSMADPVSVDPMDAGKQNSPVAGPVSDEATVMLDKAASKCVWNGQEFAEGDMVSSEGATYECTYGQWVKQD